MDTYSTSFIATGNIPSAGTVHYQEPLSLLFSICEGAMRFNSRFFPYGGKMIRTEPHWIRDHILTMKGYRYIENDMTSFMDLLLEKQSPKGFFFEILAPLADIHSGCQFKYPDGTMGYISPAECRLHEPGEPCGLCRLELEADIEYLMVEGAMMVWQATGNDEWMLKALPKLEKGLRYIMSDSLRWDAEHGLAKRPRTLDTWDFLDRESSGYDRAIHPDDPMGIFHGDNTGLYNAKMLLAKAYRHFNDDASAARHEREAEELKERIMKYLWNGTFFRHFLPLDNANYGVDEEWQLSLSNSYALNRGILSFEQKRGLIDYYRSLRSKSTGDFGDFINLYPPYPKFMKYKAGEYVNGAFAPFVAAQLALASFECGEEEYAVEVLKRMGRKFIQDGKVSFLYNSNNADIGGGPRCWCGGEIMHAECAGLAGVVDNALTFQNVTISPRFAAAKEPFAHVNLVYPASNTAVHYDFYADYEKRNLQFRLNSKHKNCKLRMLVPAGAEPKTLRINSNTVPFEVETVWHSNYAVLKNVEAGSTVDIDYADKA